MGMRHLHNSFSDNKWTCNKKKFEKAKKKDTQREQERETLGEKIKANIYCFVKYTCNASSSSTAISWFSKLFFLNFRCIFFFFNFCSQFYAFANISLCDRLYFWNSKQSTIKREKKQQQLGTCHISNCVMSINLNEQVEEKKQSHSHTGWNLYFVFMQTQCTEFEKTRTKMKNTY